MEDYKLAESILPELAWQKVLDNLTMRDDIVSFGQTCKLFRRLVHIKREIVLFDEVLPHLVDYLVPYFRRENIFKCRSVCKSWRNAVDKIYDNFFLNSSVYQARYENSKLIQLFKCYSNYIFANHTLLSCNINYEQFLTEMRNHPGNPFVGHGVRLELSYPQSSPSFEALEEFLQVFGKHIWILQVTCGPEFQGWCETEAANRLPHILQKVFTLPNLKKLVLASSVQQAPVANNLYKELQPPSTLKTADFTYLSSSEISQMVFQTVKAQLKVLFVRELETTSQFTWDNLKQLHLIMESDPKYPKTELDLLRNLNLPNLELLAFGLKSWSRRNSSWDKSARANAFKSILESLKMLVISSPNLKTIRFYSTWLWEKGIYLADDLKSNLQCPDNIKTLEIEEEILNLNIEVDFGFLKHFPSLENIHIIQTKRQRPMKKTIQELYEGESIQVYKFVFTGEMYKSNIWQILPNLKTFNFIQSLAFNLNG